MELRLDEEQLELQETVGHFCAGIVAREGAPLDHSFAQADDHAASIGTRLVEARR